MSYITLNKNETHIGEIVRLTDTIGQLRDKQSGTTYSFLYTGIENAGGRYYSEMK